MVAKSVKETTVYRKALCWQWKYLKSPGDFQLKK